MRVKTVKRYYCDFCKKAGLSKYHMERHEKHCTMNPNRDCRMCNFAGIRTARVPELMVGLPPYPYSTDGIHYNMLREWSKKMEPALRVLRERADNCPVCIMAALRQAEIPVPAVDGFDFKAECKEIFDAANQERAESYETSCYY